MEEWKDIEGYEGLYEVSDMGRIKSRKRNGEGRILKPGIDRYGYEFAALSHFKDAHIYHVARLVAIHFNGNPNDLPQVNHIDGNKRNNRHDNLEWCTLQQNKEHAMKMGLFKDKFPKGEQHHNNKIPAEIVKEIKIKLLNGVSYKEIYELYPDQELSRHNLYNIKSGKDWKWL